MVFPSFMIFLIQIVNLGFFINPINEINSNCRRKRVWEGGVKWFSTNLPIFTVWGVPGLKQACQGACFGAAWNFHTGERERLRPRRLRRPRWRGRPCFFENDFFLTSNFFWLSFWLSNFSRSNFCFRSVGILNSGKIGWTNSGKIPAKFGQNLAKFYQIILFTNI